MSGGFFEHKQHYIHMLIEDYEELIDIIETKNYSKNDNEYLEDYIDDGALFLDKLKAGLDNLKRAYVYVQRTDWFLSGDDGEDNFYIRLKEDLEKIRDEI